MHEPDDAVLATATYRVARELVVTDVLQVLLERILEVEADHVDARRHDRLGVLIADVEDVVHVLVLRRVDQAAFGALVDEPHDLLVGVHIAVIGRIVAGQPHGPDSQRIEDPHDRIRDAVEPHEHGPCAQRPSFGRVNRERLGNLLAHHHVQGGHEDVPDGNRNGRDCGVGHPQRFEQGPDQRREGGLAKEAECQRGQRDAELASC